LTRANDAVSKITSAASPTIARSIATNTGNTVVDDNSVGSGSEGDRLRARFGDFNDTYNGTRRVTRILNSTPTTPTIASARIDRPN
jgi:hypothetical protein